MSCYIDLFLWYSYEYNGRCAQTRSIGGGDFRPFDQLLLLKKGHGKHCGLFTCSMPDYYYAKESYIKEGGPSAVASFQESFTYIRHGQEKAKSLATIRSSN